MSKRQKQADSSQYTESQQMNRRRKERRQDADLAVKDASKTRITIRIDEDVIQQFKTMAPEGRGYQSLMNRALREWLSAQGVKELLQQDLRDLVRESVVSALG